MAEQTGADTKTIDPAELSKAMTSIAERSQRVVADFLTRQASDPKFGSGDPLNIGNAFMEMTAKLMSDPAKMVEAHLNLWQDYMTLWQNTARRMMGEEPEPVAKPDVADRRFKDEMWEDNEIFDFMEDATAEHTVAQIELTVHVNAFI